MKLKLIKDNKLTWSTELLEAVEDQPKAMYMTQEECEKIREQLLNKKQVSVIPDESGKVEVFKIIDESGFFIGFIRLTHIIRFTWEIEILLLKEYQNKDYARRATERVIRRFPARRWYAYVFAQNQKIVRIREILCSLGFVEDVSKNCSNEYLFIRPSLLFARPQFVRPLASSNRKLR